MTPLDWMRVVVRTLPEMGGARRAVLFALAVRMDRDGRGWASHAELATDSGTSTRTAKRATADARRLGVLTQTRRGHRLGNDQAVYSEWALLWPSKGQTDPVGGGSRGHGGPSTSSKGQTDPVGGGSRGHGGPSTSSKGQTDPANTAQGATVAHSSALAASSSSGGKPGRFAEAVAEVQRWTDATEAEALAVIEAIRKERPGVRSIARWVAAVGRDGELEVWLDPIREQRRAQDAEEALRRGWVCRCGRRNRVDATVCRQCGEPRPKA